MENEHEIVSEEVLKIIAKRIKEIRLKQQAKKYRFTIQEIANQLKMSRSAYYNIEAGKNFEIKTLIKICELFETPLNQLFKPIHLPEKRKKKSVVYDHEEYLSLYNDPLDDFFRKKKFI